MATSFTQSNDIAYVARDRIEQIAFSVPGEQDKHLVFLGDNIKRESNYLITEEYFPGADGSLYTLMREARVDAFVWTNLLSRFAYWASQHNDKWVCQIHGHTSALMFNQGSRIHAVPVGETQGGLSLMHVSLVNRCPGQQVYRGHDILMGLPWINANVQLVGAEYRLYYENADIPYYYWFDESPTWNTASYTWDIPSTANVWARVPWALEGATIAHSGNGSGVTNTEWTLEALDDSLAVLGSSTQSGVPLVTPTGTRFLQMRSDNVSTAKALEQPAIQLITHGSAQIDPEFLVDPRGLNIVIAPS